MKKDDLADLESKIKTLRNNLKSLADDRAFDEFISIIHKPGFTSVAEQFFILAVVDSMSGQTKVLSDLKQVLLTGAGRVMLNPQPLPP